MRKMRRKIFGTAALAFLLCLTGLVMTGEAQAQRFVDNGDETATDTQTGLMWSKKGNLIGQQNWHGAKAACEFITISNFSDWRLPSLIELRALFQTFGGEVPFNGIAEFPSYYWAGTATSDFDAWKVGTGPVNYVETKNELNHVWCVRKP